MNLKLETEFSKADILKEIDALKKQIDDMRPLPEDVEGRVMQKLRLDWNYHSNAIEGNRLSYGETVALLMEGITADGKPLKDSLDIRGHNKAIDFLLSIVKETRPITEADIRALHQMVLVEPYTIKAKTSEGLPTTKRITLGEYKLLPNHVETSTGEIHYYSTPEETPAKMQELMEWYKTMVANKSIHPLVTAALFHHKFVAIHPFDDGNGRLSRILMNLIVMQNGYPPVIIKMDDRKNYYALLSRADNGDSWPFVEYIAGRLQSSLQLYLKAANGGDIDEDEDIDKEISLLKMQLKGGIIAKETKSKEIISKIFFDEILPFFTKAIIKMKRFEEYFFIYSNWITFKFEHNNTAEKYRYVDKKNIEHFKKVFTENIKCIFFEFDYSEYKNPENNFNVVVDFPVFFDNFYYRIILYDDTIIRKLYHEKLSNADQSKIIKSLLQEFKFKLNENQKSPKSNDPEL